MPNRILIIDDDVVECDTLKDIFQEHGLNDVIMAYNGEDGLEKAKSENPNVIILDVIMPGMDGVDLYMAFKKEPALKKIPLFVLTAKADLEGQFKRLDIKDFITKPVDPDELVTKVKTYL